jgi:hypothetical protein
MNPVMFVLGVLSIGVGFVTLVRRLHDRSMHESLAVLRNSGRNVGPSVTAFVGLLAPIVTSIVVGVVFVRVAAMGW